MGAEAFVKARTENKPIFLSVGYSTCRCQHGEVGGKKLTGLGPSTMTVPKMIVGQALGLQRPLRRLSGRLRSLWYLQPASSTQRLMALRATQGNEIVRSDSPALPFGHPTPPDRAATRRSGFSAEQSRSALRDESRLIGSNRVQGKTAQQSFHLGPHLAACALGLLLLSGCRPDRTPAKSQVPDLPVLTMDHFLPAVREEIAKAYEQARAHPSDAEASGKLGMALEAHDENQGAEICYTRAHALDAKSFRWLYYLGVVEAAQGKNEAGVRSLRQALDLDGSNVPARLRLAGLLLACGDLAAAGDEYGRVLASHPDSAPACYGLGRIRNQQGRTEEAIQYLQRAIALSPHYGAAHYALGLAYRKLGDQARSGDELKRYQKDKASAPPAEDPLMAAVQERSASAVDLLRKTTGLEAQGQIGEAAALEEKVLQLDPKLVQAHINLISLYDRLGQPERAEAHYRAAVALNPDRADCHYNYGVFVFGHHRYREAEAAFRRAIRSNPSYAEAQDNLGFVLEQLGHPDQAIRFYRQAIANRPNFRLAHFHLGRLLASGGAYGAAISEFQQTLEPEDDNTPGYLYALGAAYVRSGDYVNGRRYMTKARDEALARGQRQMLASIDRDLETLGRLTR